MDLDDFEQDFGKPKTTSGYGGGEGSTTTASKKIKKGFSLNVKYRSRNCDTKQTH